MGQLHSDDIKRVVVRGTNWVGDSVMTIPALRALRRLLPKSQITLVMRPWAHGLFSGADFVDDLLIYDRRSAFSALRQVRIWKDREFDLAILFQNAFEAALIPFLAGVPNRLGYATESRQVMLTNPVKLPDWRSNEHEVFYYLSLIASLEHSLFGTNTVCENPPDASLEVSERRKEEARGLLQQYGVDAEGSIVAICPGSINSRAKRWPAESYASLADRLIDAGKHVLLIGSKDETDVSLEVTNRMHHTPVDLTGRTTLDQVTGVLSVSDLIVTNDTGPAHLASALGRPTLVIFGPTNPSTTRPFSPDALILRHPPDCAPCMLRDCPIDHRCMTAITVDEVLEQSTVLLKRAGFAKTVRRVCDSVA
jgi:heptosyltransferase II